MISPRAVRSEVRKQNHEIKQFTHDASFGLPWCLVPVSAYCHAVGGKRHAGDVDQARAPRIVHSRECAEGARGAQHGIRGTAPCQGRKRDLAPARQ